MNLSLVFLQENLHVSALECAHFSLGTETCEARGIVGASPSRYGAFQVSKHESKHANDTQHICVALDKIHGSVKASILTPPPILQKVANNNIRMQRLESDNCTISHSHCSHSSTVAPAKQPSRQHGRTDSQLTNSVVELGSGRVADVRFKHPTWKTRQKHCFFFHADVLNIICTRTSLPCIFLYCDSRRFQRT